ncbi:MAG: DUF748 domain-containing protein [Myxococcota bacterium]|nr:DUF748 domain-containing protein [Myxococcota bacterium]
MKLRQHWSRLSRWQKGGLLTAILVALYAALGFWVAPRVVRDQAQKILRDQLRREVEIGEVTINPFSLSLIVSRFNIPDADGSPLLRFEELFVDFELSSIYWQAFTFAEIRIQKPFVHPKIRSDGNLNVVDLLVDPDKETLSNQAQENNPEKTPDKEESGPPAVLIHLLDIQEGQIAFSDFSHETPFEYEISPLNITLRDFGTRPDDQSPYSFSASTGSGESLEWEGMLTVVPLRSFGNFTLAGIRPRTGWLYFQDSVQFEVIDGTVDLSGRYELDSQDGLKLLFEEGRLTVRDFEVVERETGERAVLVSEFDVEGIQLQYPEQIVQVDRVHSGQGEYHLKRFEDGGLRSERMATTRRTVSQAPDPGDTAAESSTSGGEESHPWSVMISQILIENQSFEFEDLSTQPPARLGIEIVELEFQNVSQDLSQRIPTHLDLRIGETGRLTIEGPIRPEPLEVELALKLEALEIDLFEPYWTSTLRADVSDGTVGFSGQVRAEAPGNGPTRFQANGDFDMDNFYLLDLNESKRITALRSLRMEGLRLDSQPLSIHLDRLLLLNPSARIVMGPEGSTNVSHLVAPSPEDAEPLAPEGPAKANNTTGEQPGPEVAVSIQKIEVQDASLDFEDRSVQPPFITSLSDFSGQIESLSSNPEEKASLQFSGRLDGSTDVALTGVASPLAENPYIDLKISLRNMGLTQFTPYSGRFIGKAIERGKLFLELDYELDGNQLVGENTLFLDQFTLGGKIPSEEALNLPVGLALALLKDRKGEIHIDLPVRGDLEDPEFSIMGIVFRALGNLIAKVALSPFSVLGGIAGSDGDDMQGVAFSPGRTSWLAGEESKLASLAQALTERPALAIELTGEASLKTDRTALQSQSFERSVRRERFTELQGKWFGRKPNSVEEVVLEEKERRRLVDKRFESAFGPEGEAEIESAFEQARANGTSQSDQRKQFLEAERERRLVAATPVDDAALSELARGRAAVIQSHLITIGGIEAERIFVLDPDMIPDDSEEPKGARIALTAR